MRTALVVSVIVSILGGCGSHLPVATSLGTVVAVSQSSDEGDGGKGPPGFEDCEVLSVTTGSSCDPELGRTYHLLCPTGPKVVEYDRRNNLCTVVIVARAATGHDEMKKWLEPLQLGVIGTIESGTVEFSSGFHGVGNLLYWVTITRPDKQTLQVEVVKDPSGFAIRSQRLVRAGTIYFSVKKP